MSENNTTEPLENRATDPATEPAHTPTQNTHVNPTKQKKKKKKKKSGASKQSTTVFYGPSGTPQSAPEPSYAEPLTTGNSSPVEEHTETQQTVLTLPVKPDEWFIKPATYDEDENIITEETFIFLKDGIEIISLPFNKNNFETLTLLLAQRFTPSENNTEADYFHIRKPLTDDLGSDPVMTLTQKNRILATTALDQKALKQLIRALQKHVEKPVTLTTVFNRWWHKHKILRVLLIIASLPFVAILLYTIFWGVTH